MFKPLPVPAFDFGMSLDDFEDDELLFGVWEECIEAVSFFNARIGTRWLYSAASGTPTGVRWEAVYPLLDRYCTKDGVLDQEKWDSMLYDLEMVEIGALDACKQKRDDI